MGTITNVQATASHYGKSSWTSNGSPTLGDASDFRARLTFPSLSGGKPITSLQVQIYRDVSGTVYTVPMYAGNDPGLTGANIASAAYVGDLGLTAAAGFKYVDIGEAGRAAISQFTGNWYLYVGSTGTTAGSATQIRGASPSNSARFNGEYSEGSCYVSDGGVWKSAVPYVNDGGTWKAAVAYVSDGGIWKQGV